MPIWLIYLFLFGCFETWLYSMPSWPEIHCVSEAGLKHVPILLPHFTSAWITCMYLTGLRLVLLVKVKIMA